MGKLYLPRERICLCSSMVSCDWLRTIWLGCTDRLHWCIRMGTSFFFFFAGQVASALSGSPSYCRVYERVDLNLHCPSHHRVVLVYNDCPYVGQQTRVFFPVFYSGGPGKKAWPGECTLPYHNNNNNNNNSMALVREWTIPTELQSLISEVSANSCG
jgi:hypothetical protein